MTPSGVWPKPRPKSNKNFTPKNRTSNGRSCADKSILCSRGRSLPAGNPMDSIFKNGILEGRVDIVVNGAAGNFLCKAEELSSNGFGTVVDIDLKGTFNVCRAAFEQLKQYRGQILNISATLHYLGTPMQLHVSAAKAGVDALTRNLAVEWGRYGIRVNAIAPGPIEDTEGMKRLIPEPIKEKLRQRIPLGRFGLIKDIENAALFLCSDAGNFISGAVLVVDGAHWLAANRLV